MAQPCRTCRTAAYLTRLRAERGLTKYAVEAATGVSHSGLFKFEHGQRFPTADVIGRLGRAYVLATDEVDCLTRCIADDLMTPYAVALRAKGT